MLHPWSGRAGMNAMTVQMSKLGSWEWTMSARMEEIDNNDMPIRHSVIYKHGATAGCRVLAVACHFFLPCTRPVTFNHTLLDESAGIAKNVLKITSNVIHSLFSALNAPFDGTTRSR